jgi:hypothetical protein
LKALSAKLADFGFLCSGHLNSLAKKNAETPRLA